MNISVYQLKSSFQNQVRPVAQSLLRSGVTPNQVTAATLFLSLAFSAFVYVKAGTQLAYILIPPFFLVRMALNAVDGLMAREGNQCTPEGTFLNEMGDVIADVALYCAFLGSVYFSPLWICLFSFLSVLTELAGCIAVQIGSQRRYDGPMGKSDRAVLISVLAILMALGIFNGELYTLLLIAACAAAVLTVFNRVRGALSSAKDTVKIPN